MSEKRTGTGCSYASVEDELYAGIRREAFGEEIGQFSWLTADEYRTFFTWPDSVRRHTSSRSPAGPVALPSSRRRRPAAA